MLFLTLILTSCDTHPTSKIDGQKYTATEVNGSGHVFLETKNFSGVIFKYTANESRSWDSTGFTPTIEEIFNAERIFRHCLEVKRIGSDGMEIEQRRIQHPSKYYRQYFGHYNPKGEKIIFMNCLINSFTSGDWKQREIMVRDGGNNYFSIKINIESQDCSSFIVNTIS
ncbi:hypothetical protein [Pedobacter immunditicola]|uniref:hypothetical protein n=1 Tax=Pedobacter immunditicola TaxID=3133440 RepID=UPI0030AA4D3B